MSDCEQPMLIRPNGTTWRDVEMRRPPTTHGVSRRPRGGDATTLADKPPAASRTTTLADKPPVAPTAHMATTPASTAQEQWHTDAPYQRTSESSRRGAVHVHRRTGDVKAAIVRVLAAAGPVRNGGQTGGLTIEEMTLAVSRSLGRPVKETTICGRVAGKCEMSAVLRNSGFTRPNPTTGADADIYELITGARL